MGTECGVSLSLLTLDCSDAHALRTQEAKIREAAKVQHLLARQRAQQASQLSADLTKQMMHSLHLLREETVARAHEYARLEKETDQKNAQMHRQMSEEQEKAEIISREEVIRNETEGILNVSQAFNKSLNIIEEHRKYLNSALKAQKRVADNLSLIHI